MNERIKELIEQAQVDGDAIHYYNPAFAKRLVELTVRECASIYDKIDNGNLHMGTNNYLEALHKTFRG